jgi:type II secretory pathway pseudopilin PulG
MMHHRPINSVCRRAMTLLEVMLAMAGVAMIGLAMSSFLFATVYATNTGKDMRVLIVKHKSVLARMSAAIRSSKMIVAQGNDYLVLWVADTDDSGTPHLAELRRIERDAATKTLRSYEAPDTLAPADNTEYDLASTNFDTATNAVKGTAKFPAETWTTEVAAGAITLDEASPQAARLVSYRFTVEANDMSEIIIGATALRAQ